MSPASSCRLVRLAFWAMMLAAGFRSSGQDIPSLTPGPPPSGVPPPPPQVEVSPRNLKELLREYKDFDLPFPKKDAPLVICSNPGVAYIMLGFAAGDKGQDGSTPLQIGTEIYDFDSSYKISPCHPASVNWDKVQLTSPTWLEDQTKSSVELNSALATAVQCQARGYTNLANELARRALAIGFVGRGAPAFSTENMDLRKPLAFNVALGLVAFGHWGLQTLEPGSDWRAIYKRLEYILSTAPQLGTKDRQWFMASLQAAIDTPPAKPGSVEALLDQICIETNELRLTHDRYSHYAFQTNTLYSRVLLMGFSAIPILVDHLTDIRLTHRIEALGMSVPYVHILVEHEVAADLLCSFRAYNPSWPKLIYIGNDADGKKSQFDGRKIWERLRQTNEADYFFQNALPPVSESGIRSVNETALFILTYKYPDRLAQLYRQILYQRTNVDSQGVTVSIRRSPLSADKKQALLLEGASSTNSDSRFWALCNLCYINHSLFDSLVVAELDGIINNPAANVASLCTLACGTHNKKIWKKLTTSSHLVNVNKRVLLLTPNFFHLYDDVPERCSTNDIVSFMISFRDDTTIHPAMPQPGNCCYMSWPKSFEVRNYAAVMLAELLRMRLAANGNWTPAQWQSYRETVFARAKAFLADKPRAQSPTRR